LAKHNIAHVKRYITLLNHYITLLTGNATKSASKQVDSPIITT